MQDIFSNGQWLPLVFAFLMGLAMLIYTVLDGYDIGVGILTQDAKDEEKDMMIASIGPFWDANETWLVLGVGLLLVAFPMAQGIVLGELYLPVAFMLFGLILRGVAFDFRVKAPHEKKALWNNLFFLGSTTMAFTQGFMVGRYVMGFQEGTIPLLFAFLSGVCLIAGYALMGATWLLMKTEGDLQRKAVTWARQSLFGAGLGLIAVSITTPMVSRRIFEKWFTFPNLIYLAPLPILAAGLFFWLDYSLRKMPAEGDKGCWKPFAATVGIYLLSFIGLGVSFYPYIVPERMLIVDAASAPGSLMFILVGALIVLPILIGYTIYAYRVFWGKTSELAYD